MAPSPDSVDSTTSKIANDNMRVVLVVCAALFFGVLNSSGVTVILPEMSAAFSVNAGQLSWVMSGYLLTYGIAIPFYGRLADKLGARPLFLLGIVLFSIGSVACLVAPSFETMLGARVLQALGGAAFPGLGMAIASRAFTAEKRGIVLGAISATIGIGSAVGPLVAGVISDLLHWRAMFGMSAFVILVFPLAWKALSRDDERSDGAMDVVGGVFMALGITGLLYAVSQSSQTGWFNPAVLGALAVSAVGLTGLVFRQQTSDAPFIPNELVKNIRYLRLITLAFLGAAVNLAALIGFPLMLSTQNGLDTFHIGLVMLPGAIATAVCGILAGRLVDPYWPTPTDTIGGRHHVRHDDCVVTPLRWIGYHDDNTCRIVRWWFCAAQYAHRSHRFSDGASGHAGLGTQHQYDDVFYWRLNGGCVVLVDRHR